VPARAGQLTFSFFSFSNSAIVPRIMRQSPDILTSVTFWASVGTLLSAAGAWFAYAGTARGSRKQNHEALTNLIAGVEAELALVSEFARGGEGDQGFLLSKTKKQLVDEHPDWFNPSRMTSKFETPMLSSMTSSPFAKSVGKRLPTFVLLNHAIRRLLEQVDRLNDFALGDLVLYHKVMVKYGAKGNPADLASSTTPEGVVVPPPHTIQWTDLERTYINLIFMMKSWDTPARHRRSRRAVDRPLSRVPFREESA
jgi:hypothetical protein